jgi:hypothetical protein
MRWLGGTTPEARADLPDVLACEGATWDGVRMRSFPHADGRDDGRMRAPRHRLRALPAIRFPPGPPSDACPVMAPESLPGDDLSRHWMRSLR